MARSNPRGILALFLLLCLVALPFSPLPLQAEEIAAKTAGEQVTPAPSLREGEEGLASYYAKRYNGRKTRSGARYDPAKLTAAHPDLPFGTRVKVVNLANDREVTVVVNDRCREKKLPFIDLSRSAAKKLGFLGRGTARVMIIPLDDEG
jgi:rare lipoprotein A